MKSVENIGTLIGTSIREYRKEKSLTQPQLAKMIGVSNAAISFWENGINIPNVMVCRLIADALEISLDELVGRDWNDPVT